MIVEREAGPGPRTGPCGTPNEVEAGSVVAVDTDRQSEVCKL